MTINNPIDGKIAYAFYTGGTAVRIGRFDAWAFIDGRWQNFPKAEAVNAKLTSKAEFNRMFPGLPQLPKIAFQDEGNSSRTPE